MGAVGAEATGKTVTARSLQVLTTVDIGVNIKPMARQSTLNVSLTPKLKSYVASRVKSGQYESASEVIRESLRALQERERFWAGVRSKVAVARRQVAEGKVVDGDAAMNEILGELGEQPVTSRRRKGAA